MTEKHELEWGQTPWDALSREKLLLTVCQFYDALKSLYCCLNMSKHSDPQSPYWGNDGSGGRALEKGRQVIDSIESTYSGENVYRAFFRYASDLLFDQSEYDIGFGWVVCPECGTMLGRPARAGSLIGQRCADAYGLSKDCPGIFGALEWTDLNRPDWVDLTLGYGNAS